MKLSIRAFIITMLLLGAISCTGCARDAVKDNGRIIIVTTIFPLYDFARNVAGEDAQVVLLIPPGAEPHTYEPKPSDLRAIGEADMFIYIGGSLEPWVEDILAGQQTHAVIIEAAGFTDLVQDSHSEKVEDSKVNSAAEGMALQDYDPHLWLDFHNDMLIVDRISEELSRINPANNEKYKGRAYKYRERLVGLDARYNDTLRGCERRLIVSGGHDVFGYIKARYGINSITAIENLEPNTEPTPKRIQEIADVIRENDISYILTEVLVSRRLSDAIASETGAQVIVFNPGHNIIGNLDDNDFISIMEGNLAALSTALEC